MDWLKNLGSWKTTSAGVAAVLTTVAHVAAAGWTVTTGDISSLLAGVGLFFAKDWNVSGGTSTTDKK